MWVMMEEEVGRGGEVFEQCQEKILTCIHIALFLIHNEHFFIHFMRFLLPSHSPPYAHRFANHRIDLIIGALGDGCLS